VLNIGAGEDWSGPMHPVARRSAYVVGVDPDQAIERNRSLDERHRAALEEWATDNTGRFDVALAVYVLEHVSEPDAFMTACARVLKPGGRFFALTPNVHHYFGATTWALSRLGLAERVLDRITAHHAGDDAAHHHHAHQHFRTEYRLNSMRQISRHLEAGGFSSVQFRCYDATARYAWYVPAGAQWFPTAYSRFAYTIGSPELMGHLSFRAVR
jgi:2-polyprenyl-3-methyl-5-hydroxy-6-metoxy-1,4-benzoquinol methylase